MTAITRYAASLLCLLLLTMLAPVLPGTHADAQAQEITTFILVRHSEKATAPANDPALSPAGVQRSGRLASLLAESGVSAIYSTEFTRTEETARPLAEREDLEIQSYDPRRNNLADWLHRRTEGGTVLVVGHSNTIPMLANQMLGEQRFEQYEDTDYGNLLILSVISPGEEASVLHLRF